MKHYLHISKGLGIMLHILKLALCDLFLFVISVRVGRSSFFCSFLCWVGSLLDRGIFSILINQWSMQGTLGDHQSSGTTIENHCRDGGISSVFQVRGDGATFPFSFFFQYKRGSWESFRIWNLAVNDLICFCTTSKPSAVCSDISFKY